MACIHNFMSLTKLFSYISNLILHGFGSLIQVFRRNLVLLDFSLSVKEATLIFIAGCGSAISCAKEEKLGFIYNLVNCKELISFGAA